MPNEIKFSKYQTRGSDYHYRQISKTSFKLYNAYNAARYQIVIQHVLANINPNNPLTILDLGCGDGVLLFLLQKYLNGNQTKIYGVDLDRAAIETAKIKLPKAEIHRASVYQTNFPPNMFDVIISSDVIEHLQTPSKMLREIKRIGKKNATIVISTPIKRTQRPLDPMHVYEYFPDEFKAILTKYFRQVTIHYSHEALFYLLYRRQLRIFGKKLSLNRYIINSLAIICKFNPFTHYQKDPYTEYTYMTAIATNL
jgi:2-polyprenyl-3-methyl-5-hydroxy-6-metoxy-1,4-benzoquinol methylase